MNEAQTSKGLPLDGLDYHILYSIAEQARHGLGIFEQVASLSEGQIIVLPATLYAVLKRMERDGWIQQVQPDFEGTRRDERRKFFRVTPLGHQLLEGYKIWMINQLPRLCATLSRMEGEEQAKDNATKTTNPPDEEGRLVGANLNNARTGP